MNTGPLIWLFAVVAGFIPGVTIDDSPLCQTPLGADRAWLAAQGESGGFELPPYAAWTEDYPEYGSALLSLEDIAVDRDVLGFFTDHRLRRIGLVVDPSLPQIRLQTLKSQIETGYPAEAPPVEIHPACFPLERTLRVVDALGDGDWHPLLGVAQSDPGPDWSVLAWPEMGGHVEVWISDPLPDVDRYLRERVGEDVELVRLVIGDDLSEGWAGTRPVNTDTNVDEATATSSLEELNSLEETPIRGERSQSDSVSSALPVVSWLVLGLSMLGLGTYWVMRRRSRRPSL